MENVISRSKYRVCTICGDAVKTEDCNIFVTDEDVLDQIICNACYRREEKQTQSSSKTQEKKQTQQSESEKRAEQKKTETTQESQHSQTSQRETHRDTSKSTDNSKNETSTTTPQRQTMTLTEAFELLKLEKDPTLTKSDVKKAFKKQVFEYHPDHGGSLEEFMRLKKARDQVQRYVEKN
jgi:curved DNA-binding protein CbpA